MKETTLESKAKKLARLFNWVAWKGSSRSGGADHIFMRNGLGFTVEFKVGDNKQQANQTNEQKIMEETGNVYYVVYSLEQFREILIEQNKRMEIKR